MQAFSSPVRWAPPVGTLGSLTLDAHRRAAVLVSQERELRSAAADAPHALPFASVLRQRHVSVIAEVKRASPSKGVIAPELDAAAQAVAYATGGAAAVSVLTEPSRFGGSLVDLAQVVRAIRLPVIRKDFLVHPVQLWEARACGASAALLIVRALSPDQLVQMMDAMLEIGLEALVEVRTEAELDLALAVDARVIGVNNRDLETLQIDPRTAPLLIPRIPAERIAVAESGMRERPDLSDAASVGADAVLIGSAISASPHPDLAVRALADVPRHDRMFASA